MPVLTQKPACGQGQQSLGWVAACCQAGIGLQDLPPTRLACLISATTSQVWPDKMRRPPLPKPSASSPPSLLKVMLLMSGAPSMRLESAGSRRQLHRSAAGVAGAMVCRERGAWSYASESGDLGCAWRAGGCLMHLMPGAPSMRPESEAAAGGGLGAWHQWNA